MADLIIVNNLRKTYGDFTAVDGISFSVSAGETFGILGPNGAGKTTTLEMMEGLKGITGGTVTFDGHDVQKNQRLIKSLIGVQLQASTFFDYLNLKELLETLASLYGRTVDAMALLTDVELQDKAKSRVKALSGGQKQRLSIAAALVNDPKAIFLDEPTTGLDPQARRHLWTLIQKIKARGKTVILTTHYMEEAEVLCDRIAIMDHAKIIALDTPMGLMEKSDIGSTIEFHVEKHCPVEHYKKLPGVIEAINEDHKFRILTTDPEKTLPALFEHNTACASPIFNLQLRQATLEDVFLKLTGRDLRE